jgi:DNA-binding winged helix-turn-helix (wHTH) protein/Tol biopolymer transport system component
VPIEPNSTHVTDAATPSTREVFVFDRFRVDIATCECWQDGEPLHLTGKAFDTLVVLLRHRDRVVTKDELIRIVWQGSFVSDDSLTQVIRSLRRALGDHATHPTFISTIPGRGYRFVSAVHSLRTEVGDGDSPTPDGPVVDADPVPPPMAPSPGPVVHARRRFSPVIVGVALAVFGIAALGSTLLSRRGTAASGQPMHLSLDVPPGTTVTSGPMLSPDGSMVAFVAAAPTDTWPHLWIRDLLTGQTRVLEDTQDPARPFWSPDGKEIAFFEGGTLSAIPVTGGKSRRILLGRNSGSGSWGTSTLLVSEGRTPIYSVSPSGHAKSAVTTLDDTRQEVSHRWPQWLPDQQHFLYYIESASADWSGTYLGSLNGEKRRLIDAPAIHTPGYLLFVRQRALFAQRFDESSRTLQGEPIALATDVTPPRATTSAALSVSEAAIAYGGGPTREQFVWFDRSGTHLGTVDAPAGLYNPSLTADQTTLLAASDIENGFRGIWRIDLKRGEHTRVTEGMRPLASPDGRRVVFTTDRARGVSDIYTRTFGGADRDELLVQTSENKVVNDWSADAQSVVFASVNPSTRWDLWHLPMNGAGKAEPFLRTPFNEIQGRLANSGKWIAYSSDETGSYEVYLQSFPNPGSKRAVSVGGGTEPHWRRDEREIFYVAPDRSLMAVAVTPGEIPQLGPPRRLFRLPTITRDRLNIAHYDVSTDGQRFLVHTVATGAQADSLKMLVNWTAAVNR